MHVDTVFQSTLTCVSAPTITYSDLSGDAGRVLSVWSLYVPSTVKVSFWRTCLAALFVLAGFNSDATECCGLATSWRSVATRSNPKLPRRDCSASWNKVVRPSFSSPSRTATGAVIYRLTTTPPCLRVRALRRTWVQWLLESTRAVSNATCRLVTQFVAARSRSYCDGYARLATSALLPRQRLPRQHLFELGVLQLSSSCLSITLPRHFINKVYS